MGSHVRSVGTLEELTRVQRWVMSILLATTILHFSAGLAIAAFFMEKDRVDARVGLNVLTSVTGVLAVAGVRALHGQRRVSPASCSVRSRG